MLYTRYHGLKIRYDEVVDDYQEMLKNTNDYMCSIEMFKRRMDIKKETRDMLYEELNKIKNELSYSNNVDDKIYYYCWILGKKINKIYRVLPCSKSTAYYHRQEIENNIANLFTTK